MEFQYDVATMTATWRFDDFVANDHYAIQLSDVVTDVEGDRLDGEWKNPVSVTTTNMAVSEFPSGDNQAGGNFVFVVTLLAGDVNRDNYEDISDHDVILNNWGMSGSGVTWSHGDVSGDQVVSSPDSEIADRNQGAGIYLNLETISLLADLDGDFDVDFDDLDIIYDNGDLPNPTQADGDLDGDGDIDLGDIDLAFAQLGLGLSVVS